MPYSRVSFRMILSDLATYSVQRNIARSLCVRWASCSNLPFAIILHLPYLQYFIDLEGFECKDLVDFRLTWFVYSRWSRQTVTERRCGYCGRRRQLKDAAQQLQISARCGSGRRVDGQWDAVWCRSRGAGPTSGRWRRQGEGRRGGTEARRKEPTDDDHADYSLDQLRAHLSACTCPLPRLLHQTQVAAGDRRQRHVLSDRRQLHETVVRRRSRY